MISVGQGGDLGDNVPVLAEVRDDVPALANVGEDDWCWLHKPEVQKFLPMVYVQVQGEN